LRDSHEYKYNDQLCHSSHKPWWWRQTHANTLDGNYVRNVWLLGRLNCIKFLLKLHILQVISYLQKCNNSNNRP
jgi:hypothetical protein